VIITGTGKLILTDKSREITFMQVDEEVVYVEPPTCWPARRR
jgi:hypothetical protein